MAELGATVLPVLKLSKLLHSLPAFRLKKEEIGLRLDDVYRLFPLGRWRAGASEEVILPNLAACSSPQAEVYQYCVLHYSIYKIKIKEN